MFDIENKIKENLVYFNDKEPDEGHEARFASKLNNEIIAKPRKISISQIMKIAAALLVVVTASYMILKTTNNNDLREEMYVTQIVYSQELNQVQSYYDELSLSRLSKIDELASSDEEAQRLKKKAIKKMEKLDANLAKIEKEYVKNPQCEKLKAAIVNNKKMKVKVVDNMVEQLDNAQRGYHAGSMYTNF
jgi:hypothetical protein